jgi:hypothetical protein
MYSNELSEIVANQRDTKNGHVIEPNHTKQNRNRRSLSKNEQFGIREWPRKKLWDRFSKSSIIPHAGSDKHMDKGQG